MMMRITQKFLEDYDFAGSKKVFHLIQYLLILKVESFSQLETAPFTMDFRPSAEKVVFSWEFVIARGSSVQECAVWDRKGTNGINFPVSPPALFSLNCLGDITNVSAIAQHEIQYAKWD
jgi:hypothetical protein